VLHEWQALAATDPIKTELAPTGKKTCLSLQCYKISIENNFPAILGIK
jgi:hypothetical protein